MMRWIGALVIWAVASAAMAPAPAAAFNPRLVMRSQAQTRFAQTAGVWLVSATDPSAINSWDAWVGNSRTAVLNNMPQGGTFANVAGTWNSNIDYLAGKGRKVELSIPLESSSGAFTLASISAGTQDAQLDAMADYAIAHGLADATVRPGWEMNAGFQPWSCFGRHALYNSAYGRVHDRFMARPGAHFKFDWAIQIGFQTEPGAGGVMFDPMLCYPGDDKVDIFGEDLYARLFSGDTSKEFDWLALTVGYFGTSSVDGGATAGMAGMDWQIRAATLHGKAIAWPEANLSIQWTDGSGYNDADGAWLTQHWVDYVNAISPGVTIEPFHIWNADPAREADLANSARLDDGSRPLTAAVLSASVH